MGADQKTEYRCYNVHKGRPCGRKVGAGQLSGDNYLIIICPRCRQPLRLPGPSDIEHQAGV